MVMGREGEPSTLKLTMIYDENENQFLIFLIAIYLVCFRFHIISLSFVGMEILHLKTGP